MVFIFRNCILYFLSFGIPNFIQTLINWLSRPHFWSTFLFTTNSQTDWSIMLVSIIFCLEFYHFLTHVTVLFGLRMLPRWVNAKKLCKYQMSSCFFNVSGKTLLSKEYISCLTLSALHLVTWFIKSFLHLSFYKIFNMPFISLHGKKGKKYTYLSYFALPGLAEGSSRNHLFPPPTFPPSLPPFVILWNRSSTSLNIISQ